MTDEVSAAELDYMQIDRALVERAVEAIDRAKCFSLKVVTAEFCTGGLIALVLSEAPGAAEYLDGGFVTYTPEQKCTALKLDRKLIDEFGTWCLSIVARSSWVRRHNGTGQPSMRGWR